MTFFKNPHQRHQQPVDVVAEGTASLLPGSAEQPTRAASLPALSHRTLMTHVRSRLFGGQASRKKDIVLTTSNEINTRKPSIKPYALRRVRVNDREICVSLHSSAKTEVSTRAVRFAPGNEQRMEVQIVKYGQVTLPDNVASWMTKRNVASHQPFGFLSRRYKQPTPLEELQRAVNAVESDDDTSTAADESDSSRASNDGHELVVEWEWRTLPPLGAPEPVDLNLEDLIKEFGVGNTRRTVFSRAPKTPRLARRAASSTSVAPFSTRSSRPNRSCFGRNEIGHHKML